MYKLTKGPVEGLAAGEVALELDDGSIVASSVTPTVSSNNVNVTFTGKVRCLTTGAEVSFTHREQAPRVLALGYDAIAKDILLALLGEPNPNPTISWSSGFKEQVNIRNAIALRKSLSKKDINLGKALGLTK